jgi:hypothetical protein
LSFDERETTWKLFKAMLAWLWQRRVRHVIALIVCAIVTWNLVFQCLREGVEGYISCDFAGQWMHGRAFYREQCDQLYRVEAGKKWLEEGYQGKHLEDMINTILKKNGSKEPEDGIEGPLYPPTAALLFSPLAAYTPQIAHAIVICIYLGLCYACGWMVSEITGGRLQFAEATLIILIFPNNFMGLILGQNQMLTLSILTLGWYCLSRRLPFVAGLVWGLLAYKPVFAVSLMLVPLVLPSLRMLIGMGLGGIVFVVATLPFTGGIEPWLRWIEVGKRAEQIYRKDRNWVWMSRDLVGLPRRKMWDVESFTDQLRVNIGVWQPGARWYEEDSDGNRTWSPAVWLFWQDAYDWTKHQRVYVDKVAQVDMVTQQGQEKVLPRTLNTTQGQEKVVPRTLNTMIGWSLLGVVAGMTVIVGWSTRTTSPLEVEPSVTTGPRAVFLLTGGLLSVLHFMHYDLMSFALPVLLFISEAISWRRWKLAAALVWLAGWSRCAWSYYYSDGILYAPWDTFLVLILWAWMGWLVWRWRFAVLTLVLGTVATVGIVAVHFDWTQWLQQLLEARGGF